MSAAGHAMDDIAASSGERGRRQRSRGRGKAGRGGEGGVYVGRRDNGRRSRALATRLRAEAGSAGDGIPFAQHGARHEKGSGVYFHEPASKPAAHHFLAEAVASAFSYTLTVRSVPCTFVGHLRCIPLILLVCRLKYMSLPRTQNAILAFSHLCLWRPTAGHRHHRTASTPSGPPLPDNGVGCTPTTWSVVARLSRTSPPLRLLPRPRPLPPTTSALPVPGNSTAIAIHIPLRLRPLAAQKSIPYAPLRSSESYI